jgi:hypothetical protein
MPMAPRENVSAGWPHRAELRSCTASGPSLCTHTNGLHTRYEREREGMLANASTVLHEP